MMNVPEEYLPALMDSCIQARSCKAATRILKPRLALQIVLQEHGWEGTMATSKPCATAFRYFSCAPATYRAAETQSFGTQHPTDDHSATSWRHRSHKATCG